MSVKLHWFLPTSGDGRTIVERFHANKSAGPAAQRDPDLDYLAQVARAAERAGFEGVLTPTGTWCEDAWLTTAALIRETQRLKFLVAFRPGVISPTLAAQMAGTFQRLSGGRVLLNIVTGGDAVEQRRFGDWHDHDARYARTDEFLTIVRGVWSGQPFTFSGDHLRVEGATTLAAPDPVPPIYFGGSSPAALPVAARHADVYLTWGEPPVQVAETGVRGLEIHPGLWAGVGLVRGGAGTALVGSHAEVADLIEEYHSIGVTEFVLSGYPHLEEAYWFGDGVRPELARRGLLADVPALHRPPHPERNVAAL